jgi:ketopantoate reductase
MRMAVDGAGGVGGYFGGRLAQAGPMSEAVYAILEPWAVRNQRTGR